jgi:plastocyanin
MQQLNRRRFGVLASTLIGALFGTSFPNRAWAYDAPHVEIKRFKFDPVELTVSPGTSVTWTNLDAAPHTATDKSKNWDTGELRKNDSQRITFEEEGSFEYFCRFHPNMKAKVTVRA